MLLEINKYILACVHANVLCRWKISFETPIRCENIQKKLWGSFTYLESQKIGDSLVDMFVKY